MGRIIIIFLAVIILVAFFKAMNFLYVGISEKFRGGKLSGISGDQYLCDSCRYDYGTACNQPQRPNATNCPEYKQR